MRGTQETEILKWPPWDKPVIYWHENQVAITFHAETTLSIERTIDERRNIIDSLKLDELNNFLRRRGFRLASFQEQDVPRPTTSGDQPDARGKDKEEVAGSKTGIDNELNNVVGKYMFRVPS